MPSRKPVHLKTGVSLEGRYELTYVVGQGSMAEVWAAYDRQTGRLVAIKVVSERLAPSQKAHKRFEREMRAIGAIHHPTVVSLLGHGQVADGRPFLAMELIQGLTLSQHLKVHHRIGAVGTIKLANQILRGLEVAHGLGIVHRDLKPANIFLAQHPSGQRQVKILDFGVAHVLGLSGRADDERLTQTGAVLGSPGYMSVEVAKGHREIDARADLFSVGGIMYHALSGRPLFTGAGVGEILTKVYAHDIEPLSLLRPDVPVDLVACVERATAHQADDRYVSAHEMRRELEAIGASLRPV